MADTIKYKRHEPLADLKKHISYYWSMENEGNEEQEHPDLLIPDGYPEIIFILEGSYYKRPLANDSQIAIVNTSSVIGIQNKSLLVKRIDKVKLFGIKFKPMGFYRFFGQKAIQTVDNTMALNAFDMLFLLELEQTLKNKGSSDIEVELVENTLLAHVSEAKYSVKEDIVKECINEILRTEGNIALDELSKKAIKSKRQIQRYFKECIGISPKKFSNLIRFKAIYKKNVLSDISLGHFFDYGYFDQSHFIKDFRTNLGITPSNTSSQKFKVQNEIAKKSVRR